MIESSTEDKVCRDCGVTHPYTSFAYKSKKFVESRDAVVRYRSMQCDSCRAEDRRANYCPEKNRESMYKRKYGVTVSWYDETLAAQGFGCKICGSSESRAPNKSERFVVDHCHTTGKVRGLLCSPCNIALGMIGDDPAIAIMLSEYLQDHKNV